MGIDEYDSTVNRSVWENKNGSLVTTVTTLLDIGEYEVGKIEKDNGNIVLEYSPVED